MVFYCSYKEAKAQLKEELKLNKELKRDLMFNEQEIEHLKNVIMVYEREMETYDEQRNRGIKG